ncbi:hypothetical protein HYH03_015980 [Edaphochlamys debaryana]|uniref:Uncharacterized protein n=1 Tax=Edaphochlamys debaryana TaxID=47281 RepID=A0A836BQD7_9CHLO|nr:hypothetical protein HYH03_015980 [Edaphochlamys debaryana]|eukprot:KAG2485306.1 hypothetical protein HYH03_015980 [Edaphochlamys debaryana]
MAAVRSYCARFLAEHVGEMGLDAQLHFPRNPLFAATLMERPELQPHLFAVSTALHRALLWPPTGTAPAPGVDPTAPASDGPAMPPAVTTVSSAPASAQVSLKDHGVKQPPPQHKGSAVAAPAAAPTAASTAASSLLPHGAPDPAVQSALLRALRPHVLHWDYLQAVSPAVQAKVMQAIMRGV